MTAKKLLIIAGAIVIYAIYYVVAKCLTRWIEKRWEKNDKT